MIWKATSESGALRHLALVWVALTTTLVFGVLTVRASAPAGAQLSDIGLEILGVPSRGGQAPAPAAPIASAASANDLIPSLETGPGPTEPSIVYAGVRWTLQEARFVSVVDSNDGYPVVIAELDLTNTLDSQNLRVRKSDLALIWSDGRSFTVDRFDQITGSASFSLEPGEFRSVTAVFKPRLVEDPIVSETALEIGDAGRVASRIPLVGPMPPSAYPIVAPIVVDSPTVVGDPDRLTGQLVIQPKRAILGLNAGPYRAAEGTRLVLIEVAVQRAMVGADSAFLQQDFWELGVDGSSNSPSRVYRQASERVGEDFVTLVFIVDETFGDLNLVVAPGLDGSTKHPIAFSG